MNERIWHKLISTRLIFGAFIVMLAFVGYCLDKPQFIAFVGILTGVYGTYVAGNTRSKNVAVREGNGEH